MGETGTESRAFPFEVAVAETSEAEVVGRALYHEKYGAACPWEADSEKSRERWRRRGALALATARELDRARGGTLSASELEEALADVADPDGRRALAAHLAAQGRTIAALQQRARAAESSMDGALSEGVKIRDELNEARATIAKRDARIAELEQCQDAHAEAVEWIGTVRDELIAGGGRTGDRAVALENLRAVITARAAAESALATLRQKASVFVASLREAMSDSEPTRIGLDALGKLEALEAILSATSAEHPDTATREPPARRAWKEGESYGWAQAVACIAGEDYARPAAASMPAGVLERAEGLAADTATLRAIRERAKDGTAMLKAHEAAEPSPSVLEACGGAALYARSVAQAHAVRDYLLGDSGPSGGGERKHGFRELEPVPLRVPAGSCRWCGTASATDHGDHCPERNATPATPPDVAASEADPGIYVAMPEESAEFALDGNPPASEAAPTPEEDWEWLYAHVEGHEPECIEKHPKSSDPCVCGAKEALARLARLKDGPRRAAENMRERCIGAMGEFLRAVQSNPGGYLDGPGPFPTKVSAADVASHVVVALTKRLRTLPLE